MHRKSESNEFDIVSEAEAVLAAYSKRCKIYCKKSERRQKGRLWRILLWSVCAAMLYGLIYVLLQMMK